MDLCNSLRTDSNAEARFFSQSWRGRRARGILVPASLTPRVEQLENRDYLSIALPAAADYAGVSSPAGIATADFDADGVPDVALVGVNPTTGLHSVGIYLGGATPVFYDLPGDNSAQNIVTGDFNGDGHIDLAVTDPVDGTVNILLNNGDGTFQTPISTNYGTAQPAGSTATADLVSADFNGDGKADLAVTDPADHQISILLGNGDGTFTLGTPITSTEASFDPQQIVTADFNGDNYSDLAYSDGTAAELNIVDGNGDGTFGASTAIAVDGAVQSLVAGDLNGDGQLDLAASVITTGGTGEVDVLMNSSGVFAAAAPQVTSFANPGPVAIGDVNGDGAADIIAMNSSGAIDVFAGNSNGGFGPATESQASTSGSPQAVITADVNGDGKADILFSEVNPAITNGGGFGLILGTAGPEVSPTIAGALPTSAIAGQKTQIIQTVSLTNISDAPVQGTGVSVALSTDANYSSDDTVIDSVTVKAKVGVGKTKSQRLKITNVPAGLTPGNYFVVVQATDSAGGVATTSSTGTINIVAPEIDLSGTFKKVPTTAHAGKPLSTSITVTNDGNVSETGLLPIVVDTSLINTLDDTAIQDISLNKKLNLKPGKSVTIQLSHLIAPSAANAYYLIVQLDPSNTLGDVNTANNTFATENAIPIS